MCLYLYAYIVFVCNLCVRLCVYNFVFLYVDVCLCMRLCLCSCELMLSLPGRPYVAGLLWLILLRVVHLLLLPSLWV